MNKLRIALVTGGNRGIGKEICKQLAKEGLHVLVGSRDIEKGKITVLEMPEDLSLEAVEVDVNSLDSIQKLLQYIETTHGRLDVLVNNAGVFLDKNGGSVLEAPMQIIEDTMNTNLYGPLRLTQATLPLMKSNGYGRIVNLSSGMGQLSGMGGGSSAYRLSKTALNALTRIVNAEIDGNIKINSMCPGWVKTDMGGENATRSVEQGADTATWLATLDEGGPSGGFFRDRAELDW